ncbi:hypothetical protein JCM10213_003505 [Rhodosporidiobolus nylandii]
MASRARSKRHKRPATDPHSPAASSPPTLASDAAELDRQRGSARRGVLRTWEMRYLEVEEQQRGSLDAAGQEQLDRELALLITAVLSRLDLARWVQRELNREDTLPFLRSDQLHLALLFLSDSSSLLALDTLSAILNTSSLSSAFPFFAPFVDGRRQFAEAKRRFKAFGQEARGCILVKVVEPESKRERKELKGVQCFHLDGLSRDLPREQRGRKVLIHPHLPRLTKPSLVLLLDAGAVRRIPALHFLAQRDPSLPISSSEVEQLQLPLIHDLDQTGLLLAARIDAAGTDRLLPAAGQLAHPFLPTAPPSTFPTSGVAAPSPASSSSAPLGCSAPSESPATTSSAASSISPPDTVQPTGTATRRAAQWTRIADAVFIQTRVLYSIACRGTWWRRGGKQLAGAAVGAGVRVDFLGLDVGLWSNVKHTVSLLERVLLHQREAELAELTAILLDETLPGHGKYLRELSTLFSLPNVGETGFAATYGWADGFDGSGHSEAVNDACWTVGWSGGAAGTAMPQGGAFALPGIDGGRGVVMAGGEGVWMVWCGRRITHSQSIPLDPSPPFPSSPPSHRSHAAASPSRPLVYGSATSLPPSSLPHTGQSLYDYAVGSLGRLPDLPQREDVLEKPALIAFPRPFNIAYPFPVPSVPSRIVFPSHRPPPPPGRGQLGGVEYLKLFLVRRWSRVGKELSAAVMRGLEPVGGKGSKQRKTSRCGSPSLLVLLPLIVRDNSNSHPTPLPCSDNPKDVIDAILATPLGNVDPHAYQQPPPADAIPRAVTAFSIPIPSLLPPRRAFLACLQAMKDLAADAEEEASS